LTKSFISWLLPALLFLTGANAFGKDIHGAVSKAGQLKLHDNQAWLSLLHIKQGVPQIDDPRFILSGANFTPKNELEKSLEFIFEDSTAAKCRFPARFFLLNHYLGLKSFGLEETEDCTELQKYKNYVPYDQLNLIYASEVLASASSMMGHSFLNAKGANVNQTQVSHSISFFTELDSFNPAALIYDGLVSGMKGLFIVRPFKKDLKQYSQTEGRNVWSYSLKINDFHKNLIKLHIWELKDIEIEYLFQSYNCATLTLYILSIANPDLVKEDLLFVSPLDVVKAASKHGMIENVGVELSDDWALKMLEQEIDPWVGKQIESMVLEHQNFTIENLDPKTQRIAVEYLSRLIDNKVVRLQLSESRYKELSNIVEVNRNDTLNFDLAQFKDPIKTPQDSMISASLVMDSENTGLDLSFLPASHYLYGDNRQYFSESELKIGELILRVESESEKVKIQSLTLYSFRSLVPSSKIVPKYSSNFHLGYRQILDSNLKENGFFDVSGGLGKTIKVHQDILLFGNMDIGLALNKSNAFFYTEPSTGAIIQLVGDAKIIFEYRLSVGQYDTNRIAQSFSTDLSWYGIKNWTFRLAHRIYKTSATQNNELQLGMAWHF
jgi:hypothetical protein